MERLIKRVEIEKVPCSPWQWQGKAWYVYKKVRDSWLSWLTLRLGRLAPKSIDSIKRVQITIYKCRVIRDETDNLRQACKPIIDCLKEYIQLPSKKSKKCPWGKAGLGYFKDDSQKYMTWDVKQIKAKKIEEKTIIEIWENINENCQR